MKHILVFLFLLIVVPSFAQYKNKSAGFIENKGQIIDQKGKPNSAVKFLLNSNGLNVQLRKNGFSYDIYEVKKTTALLLQISKKTTYRIPEKEKKEPEYNFEYVFHRVDIDFVNSNSNVEFVKEQESKDFDNYYNIPNNPKGILGVHSFKQITYKNIYPNIDVVFTIPSDSLKTVEYNFIVHPKGKISDIQLKFNGAKTELIDNKIRMSIRFGEMDETLPASWTEDKTGKKDIAIGYKKIKNHVYGFEANEKLSNKTLVIDPVPIRLWGTYFGGGSINLTKKIKTDKQENIVSTGETSSATNIATSGAFQTTKTSIWDASFLSKFSPDGNRIWGTYINSARIFDLVINTNNEIYLGGSVFYNSGDNLPTFGAYKASNPDFSSDGLILKFNANGQQIWGTLYGGIANESINTLSLDNQENLIIAGETNSKEGIATSGAFQSVNNDPFDGCGFFAKFSPLGNRISGSYFPGKVNYSIIDDSNNLILAGQYRILDSDQPDISTPGAHQTQIYFMDGFIVKFNSMGQRLWCTYYGGDPSFFISVNDYYDRITGLGVDALNNIYVSGVTNSNNNISTPRAYKENQVIGGVDAFIVKFNPNGVRQWGTYYGSDEFQGVDKCESSFTSKNGDIYITGNTRSQTGIATTGSFQPVNYGSDEGFISKFDTSGNLLWGTYYGGSDQDFIKDIYYRNGNIYIIGTTTGSANLGTLGTEYPNLTGGNTFIAKFQDCLSNPIASSNSPICIGKTLELKASGGTDYLWKGPNGFTSTLQNPTIPDATALNSGQYSCSITGTGGCDDTKKVDIIIGDIEAPITNLATLPVISGDCNTTITTFPTATDACAGTIIATTTSPLSYNLPGTYTVVWKYDDGNGNSINQNQNVTITSQLLPIATSPQTFCIQQNATLSAVVISGQNIKWYDSQTNGTLSLNTTIPQNGTTYYASQTINSCESERVPVLINIVNTAAPTGNSPQTFCSSQNPTLATIVLSGTTIRWYDNATNGLLLPTTTPLQNGITYYASQTENGCESVSRIAVTIELINTLPASNYEEFLCDDLNDGTETVNLNNYESNIISSNPTYTLSYYSTVASAENELSANKITNTSNYRLSLGTNIIYVRINSNTPCYAITTLKLTVVAKPIIPIADSVPICANNTISINAGASTDSFLWSTGATTPSITIVNPGEYAVTVTRNYGRISCSSSKKFSVKKSTIATITSIETLDWTDKNNMISIYVSGAGSYEYSVDGIRYQDSNEFQNLISGAYTVYVRDQNGCGVVTDKVYLLMYPKFFTPNGDGYNDTWSIHFSDTEVELSLQLFDRYGKLITVLNQNQTWDGTFNGHELPSTDYWFIVTRADGKEYKGHFTLKR
jgi:gliding motility-associated-like protein